VAVASGEHAGQQSMGQSQRDEQVETDNHLQFGP
jgi:hypothetical protein